MSSGKTFLKLKQNQILKIVREEEILFQHLLCTKKGLKTLYFFVIDLLFQVIKYNSSPLVIYSSPLVIYSCCIIYPFIKDFFKMLYPYDKFLPSFFEHLATIISQELREASPPKKNLKVHCF